MPQTLTDILRTHKIQFRQHGEDHHVTHGWLGCNCPWCGGSGFHFGFHLGSGAASCWKCGPHNRTAAVARLCKISYESAGKLLGDEKRQGVAGRRERPVTALVMPKGVEPLGLAHRRYLGDRGLPADAVENLWGVRGIGLLGGYLAWRLWIPIRNPAGETVSWTTRAIGDQKLRYISAAADQESEPHRELLYGAELARDAVIVVEGPTDAWAIGPGAVATCGVGFSPQQVAAISHYPVRVVCFDRDRQAQRRAIRLCESLAVFPGKVSNVELETGGDPADADPAEIAEIRSLFLA